MYGRVRNPLHVSIVIRFFVVMPALRLPAQDKLQPASRPSGAAIGTSTHCRPDLPKKRATGWVALFAVNSVTKKLPAITSAATIAVAATTTAISTAAEVIALRHRLGFVNCQRAPVQLCAVQGLDGFLGLAAGAHLDEAETSRLPGELVGDHIGRFHGPVLRKDFVKPVTCYGIWQTADV